MATPATLTLDHLLRLCADASPSPWHPSTYAKATNTDRDSFDEPLTQLRLAGLVKLTDWQPGQGQGYALTDAGRAILASPRALARLRAGELPNPPDESPSDEPRMTTWERGEAVREALLAPGSAPMTWLLIAGQIFVFAAAMYFAIQRRHTPLNVFLHSGTSPVLDRLAVSTDTLASGQWWRLLTYSCVHAGAMHLLFNMVGLATLGPVVERMLGSMRFIVLWIVSALGGGCAVVLSGPIPTVGASGAICGLLGAIAAFVVLNRQHLGSQQVAVWRRWLFGAVAMVAFFSLMPQVSWSCHLGGAVAGLIAGALLNYQRFGSFWQRWTALLALAALMALFVGVVLRSPVLAQSRMAQAEEANRQAILREVAEEQLRKHREEAEFLQRIKPEIDRVTGLFVRVCFEYAEPLVRFPPLLRDGDQVRGVLVSLDALAEEQAIVSRLLADIGPYQTFAAKEAYRRANDLLETEVQLTNATRQCLLNAAADEPRRQEQVRRFQFAAQRWLALFNESRSDAGH